MSISPDSLVKSVITDVIHAANANTALQQGDVQQVFTILDEKIRPHVDFVRVTALATGRHWRDATPIQQQELVEQFTLVLYETFVGAIAHAAGRSVELKAFHGTSHDVEVEVKTRLIGKGQPVSIDVRLMKTPAGWHVYDVASHGEWIVQTFKSSFAEAIARGGIDGLIAHLKKRNEQLASRRTTAPKA